MTFPGSQVTRQGLVLDFDIENRPLSYMGSDFTSAEITAIAWAFYPDEDPSFDLLFPPPSHVRSRDTMLRRFREAYDRADVVTGHYIRKHDLPIVNGAMLEAGFPPLTPKLTVDTKLDLVRKKDLPATQEALADMFGLPEAKHHMSQREWRESNRLTPLGRRWTRKRVVDDVIQHQALYKALRDGGYLKAPKVWSP